MFGYRCQECGKGTVRTKQVKNYEARFGNRKVIVPIATIGICDFCGAKHYSASERKRWKALLGQTVSEQKRGRSLTISLTAREWNSLQKVAQQRGILLEELARGWILEKLWSEIENFEKPLKQTSNAR